MDNSIFDCKEVCHWKTYNIVIYLLSIKLFIVYLPVISSLTESAKAVIFSVCPPVSSIFSLSTIPIWQLWVSGSYFKAEHCSALSRQCCRHWNWELKMGLRLFPFYISYMLISYGLFTSGNSEDVTKASDGAEMWLNLVTFGLLARVYSNRIRNRAFFIYIISTVVANCFRNDSFS